jgi:hypothetical protein
MIERNRRSILADYARLKLDPVYAKNGTLISPSLLFLLNRMPREPVVQNAFEGEDMR